MSPEDEIEQCLYELRLIAALMCIAEACESKAPEDILTALGLEIEGG
jgi:hypothetical protein